MALPEYRPKYPVLYVTDAGVNVVVQMCADRADFGAFADVPEGTATIPMKIGGHFKMRHVGARTAGGGRTQRFSLPIASRSFFDAINLGDTEEYAGVEVVITSKEGEKMVA